MVDRFEVDSLRITRITDLAPTGEGACTQAPAL
jgi:hypothetical protein